jgi:predicted RNA-binding Zn ribbon-like protein
VVRTTTRLPRYQRNVDGLVLPVSVTDQPALDFCNTRAGWNSAEPREYLVTYDHLVVWAREASLIDAEAAARLRHGVTSEPAAARRVLDRALALRSAIHTTCTDPDAAAAWDEVATAAHAAAAAAVLVREAPPGRRWAIPESTGPELPLLELGRAAGALLASTDLSAVRSCPGHDCGWLFLDPRRRRRWCTMAVCGNRAKARRHAARAKRA